MKQIILLTTLLLVSATACKKDFLEVEPLVGSTEVNYYQTAGDARSAIIACYNPLQQEVTTVQGTGQLAAHFRWYFGDIVSDDSEKGGASEGDEADLFEFENFQGNSSSSLVLAVWQNAYKAIAYCNIALEKIPDIDMDAELKARYLAEARFIRGFSYYQLATMFGGVPIVLETLAPSEYQQPSASEEAVWGQVVQDLTAARDHLPRRSELSISQVGRATWGAATGLLAKAHAWRSQWGEAFSMADEVVMSGEYFLVADYGEIFTLAGENGPGSIWEIQYMDASGGNWGNQLEGTFTNVFQRARGIFGGFGFNIPTQDLVDEYEEGDPRLSATIFQVGDQMGDRGVFTLEASGQPYLYHPRKYFINSSEEASLGDPNPNGPSNSRVLRYADILLLHAEAAYHTGAEGVAMTSLEEVRARARAGNSSILPEVDSGGQDLLEAIYHERRVELALEGHRFFDLVRQGRAAEVMQSKGFSFVEGVHERFPVPQAEITLSGGLISQNPGY